jgi:hypothetical protein
MKDKIILLMIEEMKKSLQKHIQNFPADRNNATDSRHFIRCAVSSRCGFKIAEL